MINERLIKYFITIFIKLLSYNQIMKDPKPIFKSPYDLKDVSILFLLVAFVLIFFAIIGNNLFGIFQNNVNFGNI